MQRRLLAVAALVAVATVSQQADAAWSLRTSFGQSIYLVQPAVTPSTLFEDPLHPGETISKLNPCGYHAPCYDGNRRRPLDLEIMPYYNFGLITLDLGLLFNFEQRNDLGFQLQFRPGVRIFPFLGLYFKAAFPIAAASINAGSVYLDFALNLGVGYQFKLGPWGFFAEVALNPALRPPFNMPIEFRLGIALEP